MNNSIELAQAKTQAVTAKQLLAMLKVREDAYMHGTALYDRPTWSDAFTFEVTTRTRKTDKRPETTAMIEVPGYVSNGSTSDRKEHTYDGSRWTTFDGVYRPTKGFWSLGCARARLLDILDLLGDAPVAFGVFLDHGTNELCIRADCDMRYTTERGLHADHLYLIAEVTRNGKTRERQYFIDATVSAHNSARFGGGHNS